MRATRNTLRVGCKVRNNYGDVGEVVYVNRDADEFCYMDETANAGLIVDDIDGYEVEIIVRTLAQQADAPPRQRTRRERMEPAQDVTDTIEVEGAEPIYELDIGCYIHDRLHGRRGTVTTIIAGESFHRVWYTPARRLPGEREELQTNDTYISVIRPAP